MTNLGGGTEENKSFDCEMFPLDFQKKHHFLPSKHKANIIVSLPEVNRPTHLSLAKS